MRCKFGCMDTFIDWTKNKNAKLKCYFISNKRVNQVLSQQSLWALSADLAHPGGIFSPYRGYKEFNDTLRRGSENTPLQDT